MDMAFNSISCVQRNPYESGDCGAQEKVLGLDAIVFKDSNTIAMGNPMDKNPFANLTPRFQASEYVNLLSPATTEILFALYFADCRMRPVTVIPLFLGFIGWFPCQSHKFRKDKLKKRADV